MKVSKRVAIPLLPLIIGAAALIAVVLLAWAVLNHTYWIDVAGSERPSDQALTKIFVAHRAELEQARCEATSSEAARSSLSRVGVQFASCDYDNTLRLGFDGSTRGGAIGPGWAKGLTHIPQDPERHGVLVASTDGSYRLKADVYLRPLGGGWFIWFQRDD
jgi:hypothetical protein